MLQEMDALEARKLAMKEMRQERQEYKQSLISTGVQTEIQGKENITLELRKTNVLEEPQVQTKSPPQYDGADSVSTLNLHASANLEKLHLKS